MLHAQGALRHLLRHRAFTWYLLAKFLAAVAVQMLHVAVGWQVYRLTRDPLDLGLIGLSQFLPFIVMVLPAGQLADRINRKLIMFVCFSIEWLAAVALLMMAWNGITTVAPVMVAMVLLGLARAFVSPAQQALLPNLVPRDFFAQAIALNSSTWQLATISGPALGGLLYLAGERVVYAASVGLLLVSVVLITRLRAPPMPVIARGEPRWQALLAGLHFVRQRPLVLGALSLDLFAVMFGGATALLPAIASDVLHVGPAGLGLLRAAPGVGAALVALRLASRPPVRHCGRWVFFGVGTFGLATVVFGLSSSFLLSLGALFCMGGADMLSVYVRQLLVQLETPDALRGRVSAVNAMFIGASNEFGEFESGVTASWWGVVPAIVVGGVATLGVTALWTRWFSGLYRLDRMPERARDPVAHPLVEPSAEP